MTKPKPQDPAEQSWDDFWAEQQAKAETTIIQGVTVRIPTEVTLGFEKRLKDVAESDDEDDIRAVVRDLFGSDVYDQWVTNGMTVNGYLAAMGWGMARAQGRTISFREAYDMVLERQANPPQAANRTTRRAASKPRSSSTGATSKRTSGAATASRQRKSPA